MYYEIKQTLSCWRANSALHTHTHTQLLAQEPKWGIHNSIVDYQNLSTSPLPTSPNPDYTQNAIWDANGDPVIYEADGIIYNKNGGVILDMEDEAKALYGIGPLDPFILKGFTEFIFVPVPEVCDQYYGIITYNNGSGILNPAAKITDIVWCKIDVTTTMGIAVILPQTGLKVAKESINCDLRSTRSENKVDYAIHIEATKELLNGNRYLFAADGYCVSVLNIEPSGINYIDGYQNGVFAPNLRSEMEVFQNGETYEIAMSCYQSLNLSDWYNHISIFEFDMSSSTPIMSHYNVPIALQENDQKIVKGLEFSTDGLSLYASIMTIDNSGQNITSGDNLIYVGRNALSQHFQFNQSLNIGGVISSGSLSMDYGIGMIEKGRFNHLWFVGNNRMATLANQNDPTSIFTISTFAPNIFINALTNATGYNNGVGPSNPPTFQDINMRKMYLLVDQIDGEDYSSWTTGSDLFPSNINVCSYPYTFSYSIPANAIISFTGQMSGTPPNIVIESDGILTISYVNANGCEYTETIEIKEREGRWCSADFSWMLITHSVDPDVQVDALCNLPLLSSHEFYLYELDSQGVWQLIDSCFTKSCTLTGLSSGHSYKIEHIVHNNSPLGCHPIETSTQIFTI